MIETLNEIHRYIFNPEHIPIAVAAWLVVAVIGMIFGPLGGNANPFMWGVFNRIFGRMGLKLDKKARAPGDLMFRGLLFTIFFLVLAYFAGVGASYVVEASGHEDITEILFLSLSLTAGSIWFVLLQLYFAMRDNKVSKGAYYALAHSTHTDFSGADDFALTRAGMGFAARSFDKGLVAPVFWYLLFGLPGAYVYAVLAALCWRYGRMGFTKGFGKIPLALEKLLGLVPHVLAGGLIALAGLFTPTGGMTRAFLGQVSRHGKARYEEGGLPLTAMAYALNVSLGGPATDLDGRGIKASWTGPKNATAQLAAGHLRRGLYINLMAHFLFAVSLVAATFWGGLLF